MNVISQQRNSVSIGAGTKPVRLRGLRLSMATLLLVWQVPLFAATLSMMVDDDLGHSHIGDTADRSVTHGIITGFTDSFYLRDGINAASFNYRIVGQVSADDGIGPSSDRANLFGSVLFDFDLPTALWDIDVDVVFRGVQDAENDPFNSASASAGNLTMNASGSANGVSDVILSSGTQTFFNRTATPSVDNSTLNGAGQIRIRLDMSASSDDVFIVTGSEAFASIGQFSTLDLFSLDDALNSVNPLSDDGVYLTLTFRPHLDLSGQTLVGDLALENGEVLTGRGTVIGDISGVAGSSIDSRDSELRLGHSSSTDGFNFAGDLKVNGTTVTLFYSNAAIASGNVSLAGGNLKAFNGLSLAGNAVLSGFGTVDAKILGGSNTVIMATSSGLELGNASATDGFDFDGTLEVGNSSVNLKDADGAHLGSSTTLGGGVLQAANGIVLGAGETIVGHGRITAGLVNQGRVDGQGPNAGDGLELSGRVSGAGSYAGNVNFSGTFSPGNSPAEIMLENVALTGILEMEIGGLMAGTEYDWLNVSGTASLAGTLEILLFDLGGGTFMPQAGDSFDLITAETITGEFELLNFAALGDGLGWNLAYLFDDLGTDIVRLSVVDTVPLPAAAWLFASALLATAGLGRKRAAVA